MRYFIAYAVIQALTFFSTDCFSQIYYHQSPGSVTVSATSSLLPTTSITPSGVTSNNPGSTPVAYNTAFSDQVNQIFLPLNRSYANTGLLKDYGIDFTDVGRYNGVRTSSNYLIMEEWQALYVTLYSYRFNNFINMTHPTQVNEIVTNYGIQANGGSDPLNRMIYASSNPVTHHIAGLHYRYQQFKANAVSSNLVYISNDQVYDTPGRPESPYETKDAFAFSLPHTTLEGTDHKFIIRSDLFFTNTGKTISALQMDFADGVGYRSVSFNTLVSIYYSTNGVKTVLFKVTYTDGTIFESHSQVEVTGIPDAQQNQAARYSGSNISPPQIFPRSDYPAPLAYLGQTGRAIVTIEYGQNNGTTIKKPFIFIEGFDPWNITDPDNPEANRDFFDIVRQISESPSMINNPTGQNLSDALDANDYDFIHIDFVDATDYIQRNAYLVENIIEWVNSVKQPYNGVRQQNVVVGVSMGGLVGRYALKHMENRGVNHEARLFCAFDSPHQGANIPLAIQAAATHLDDIGIGFGLPGFYVGSLNLGSLQPKIGRVSTLLSTPAVRQMVKYRVFHGDEGFVHHNLWHDSFASEYSALGYPVNSRNILISNGSECGANQGFPPYTELMNVDSTLSLPNWTKGLLTIFAPLSLATTSPQLSLLWLPSTKMDIKAQFILRALPDQQQQQIYYGKIYIKRKILGLINMNIVLSSESLNSNSSFLPVDNSGGGVYDIDVLSPGLALPLQQKRFGFIPTYSGLDIGGGTQTIISSDLSMAYSPASSPPYPKNVRANNFVTGSKNVGGLDNENHVQITARNGAWLFQEIQGTSAYSSCVNFCSGSTGAFITGTGTVCNNSTFTLHNIPSGATISWSQSSNLAYVSGQGTTTYIVTKVISGAGFVNATITTTDCGSFLIPQINVQVGGFGSSDYPVTGPSNTCRNETVYYNTVDLLGATYYDWFWPSDWTYSGGQGTRYLTLITGSSSYGGAVGVRVANACDAGGSPATLFTYVSSCGGYSAFTVYPNPVYDEITISLDDFDSLGNKKEKMNKLEKKEFEVSLFDNNKNKIATLTSKDEMVSIPVRNLPEGLYYINILFKEGIIQRQILVKRN